MRACTAGRQRGGANAPRRQLRRSADTAPQYQATNLLDDDTRYRLLQLLTEHPNHSQRELASELGLSLGKTNFCLRALIAKGWVKVQNFRNSHNKLAYAYVLTPSGAIAKLRATTDFLRRKQEEYSRLEREIEALRRDLGMMVPPTSESPPFGPGTVR